MSDPQQLEPDEATEIDRIYARYGPFRVPTGPAQLGEEYLRMVAEVESAPENQDGADKTWVWRADRAFRRYYEEVWRNA